VFDHQVESQSGSRAASRQGRLCSRIRAGVIAAALAVHGGAVLASPKSMAAYEDAIRRHEAEDHAAAIIQLKNALKEDPKMLAAHVLLGRSLFKSGQLKAAEAAFQEALKLGVAREEVVLDLGRIYLLTGEARRTLELVPAVAPTPTAQAEALTVRAMAYSQLGDQAEALRAVAAARAAAPSAVNPLLLESQLRLRQGEIEAARAAAQRATDLAPNDAAAWVATAQVQQQSGDAKSALATLDRALGLNPRHAEGRVNRAGLRMAAGLDAQALEDLNALKAASVNDPRAAYFRGVLATRKGDVAQAKTAFQEAVAAVASMPQAVNSADDQMLMIGALSAKALGNREQAREYAAGIVNRNPRHLSAQLLLAELLVEAKDFRRARPMLLALRDAMPKNPRVLSLLGSTELALKNYGPATELLEQAVKLDGSSSHLRELGSSQLGAGKDAQGLATLEKAFAAKPPDIMAGIQLAMIHARRGNGPKALATAEAVLKQDPENLALHNFLANIKGRLGDKAGARKIWEAALAKDPAFRHIVINLSWLDIEQQRFDEARARLLQHLARQADDPDVLFQLGTLEHRARRLDEAERHWQRGYTTQRKDMRPGMALIDLWLEQQLPDKALPVAKAMREAFPAHHAPLLAVARVSQAKGDMPAARSALTEATRVAGADPETQVTIGRIQLSIGEVGGAAYNVVKALQASPDDLGALALQVEVEARRGDQPAVDAALKTLVAKHPTAVPTMVARGSVALARGNLAGAVADFQSAMNAAPSTPMAILLSRAMVGAGQTAKAAQMLEAWARKQPGDKVALMALGEVQAGAGQVEAARASYAKLMAMDPDNPTVLSRYALMLHRINDPGALAAAEKAHQKAPSRPENADLLGWILARKGNVDAALPLLRDARLRQPESGEIRFHLAYALAKSGRTEEARTELKAALEAGGLQAAQSPEVAKLRADLGVR